MVVLTFGLAVCLWWGVIVIGERTNVKTVLFTKHDVEEKTCWSRAEISLVFARYLMQALLPRTFPTNVTYLNEYISLCVGTIHDLLVNQAVVEMMMNALEDTMGGYLQAFGLPLAREAYYEGILDLDSVQRLYNTQHCFKAHLKTNGKCWTPAVTINKPLAPITPMKVRRDLTHNYCHDLVLMRPATNCPAIPMPFFDDCHNPRAIAIPFAKQRLHSLKSNQSLSILSRYYEVSLNCIYSLTGKLQHQKCISTFNRRFSEWMRSQLVCHLHGQWYPALHGVLRVLRAADKGIVTDAKCDETKEEEMSSAHFALVVGLLLALFWLVIALAVLCRKCCVLGDGSNRCHRDCDPCKAQPRHCTPSGARLFTYNLSCWRKNTDDNSSSQLGRCVEEPNYVEIERYVTADAEPEVEAEPSLEDDEFSSIEQMSTLPTTVPNNICCPPETNGNPSESINLNDYCNQSQ